MGVEIYLKTLDPLFWTLKKPAVPLHPKQVQQDLSQWWCWLQAVDARANDAAATGDGGRGPGGRFHFSGYIDASMH